MLDCRFKPRSIKRSEYGANYRLKGEFRRVSFAKKSLSIFGNLGVILLLLAAFSAGLGGVLYLALRSPEVKVPEIVGKDYNDGEKDLASLDLKIRKRTDRFSAEKPNTILEQIPLPGDTVKAGQTISVVISRAQAEGDEKPAEVKKDNSDDKDKNKDVDEPTDVDKARAKRKAANVNKNANANKNSNGNSNDNSNANSNGSANSASNGNSSNANSGGLNSNSNANRSNSNANRSNSNASRTNSNNGGNSNNRPAAGNSNGSNRSVPTLTNNRNINANRRPQ